ncbi:MAG: hypothetical protein Ta2B_16650 [Termitinemataceae bacterium]|nr:MAG: hypothetical protein Ta2B_16650 [Termitinemataceae bacterium]
MLRISLSGNKNVVNLSRYSHPIGKIVSIGIGASMLRETSYYDHLQNAEKWTNIVRVFTEWKIK